MPLHPVAIWVDLATETGVAVAAEAVAEVVVEVAAEAAVIADHDHKIAVVTAVIGIMVATVAPDPDTDQIPHQKTSTIRDELELTQLLKLNRAAP